ncbi:beta-N-acetylhexosaminidase [Paenibacillus ginsengarvi]|uniref:Beta-N-acetylhexosaminidase n=1 Tax=Paenibacillus ginsengarvi TaxID=400777 RepID=A0A3B0BST0_9BACL|nr:beta-N-acetylhexosaminidase [Paenibacillus ginsengarvi]RKN75982.1 beta-N-acetylhexosaminidase [Paenibacillus ginsengarvi]
MRPIRFASALLLSVLLTAGCTGAKVPSENLQGAASPQETKPPNTQPETPQKPVPEDPIQKKLGSMTLEQKLGQMVMAGVDGTKMDEQAKSLIANDFIGGFILYKPNIESTAQTATLLNELKEANRGNPAPLLLSVDQEGGKVSRMPGTLVPTPASRDIAKTGDKEKARAIGKAIGAEVRALGFNVDFAPVLDIDSNPNNPVIGNRSFGPTAAIVSSFGLQQMEGLRSERVIPVVKHFPGHGDTSVDSHLELPVVSKTLDQLRKLELVPFADAIRSDADMVMVAHILLPQLDPDHPSSMSPTVIGDLLRKEMGFGGVVITDDMTMGAILKHNDLGEAAVQSVKAGADIVLVAHEYAKAKMVIGALKQAVQSGAITADSIDRSVYRILALKERYKLSDAASGPVNEKEINDKLQKAVGSP